MMNYTNDIGTDRIVGLAVIAGLLFLAVRLYRHIRVKNAALMMRQVSPHFIYNTLGAIQAMIKVSPDTAYQMLGDFSTYLRANIDTISNYKKIKFSEELRYIKAYTSIEQMRFGERLKIIYDIREEEFRLPPISVQILVENAVVHGIQNTEGGCVWIRSYQDDKFYVVEVEDDGKGFDRDTATKKHTSTGLKNAEFRLRELSNASLSIHSEKGVGTKAIVRIPKKKGY